MANVASSVELQASLLVLYPGQLFSRSSHAIGNEGSTYTPGALVTS